MDKMQILTLALGSAAIGALVSGVINELGKWRERKSRRQELLLQEALKLADWRIEILKHNAQTAQEYVEMDDKVIQAERYYKLLKHLMHHGRLPEAFIKQGKFPA